MAKIFEIVLEVMTNRQKTYKTTILNRWLQQIKDTHPPSGLKNSQPKLQYIVHEEGNPNPSFKVFGSDTRFLHWSYKRYMERKFRESFELTGTPVKFWFIDKRADSKKETPGTE